MRPEKRAYRGRAVVPRGGGPMPDRRKAAEKKAARGKRWETE